jgi:hypothetical protein
MRKNLYNFLLGILENIPAIVGDGVLMQHIDVWNNQYFALEDEQPFPVPAVFIEFQPITMRLMGRGRCEAEVIFNLHIIADSRSGEYADSSIQAFNVIEAVQRALHGKSSNEHLIGTITCINSETDNNFSELMHNIETFSCRCEWQV